MIMVIIIIIIIINIIIIIIIIDPLIDPLLIHYWSIIDGFGNVAVAYRFCPLLGQKR